MGQRFNFYDLGTLVCVEKGVEISDQFMQRSANGESYNLGCLHRRKRREGGRCARNSACGHARAIALADMCV